MWTQVWTLLWTLGLSTQAQDGLEASGAGDAVDILEMDKVDGNGMLGPDCSGQVQCTNNIEQQKNEVK